jgi:cysteine desulfurase/selenocysteine lyase
METIELSLQKRFIEFLLSKPGVRIVGPAATGPSRVATIAFLSEKITPQALSLAMAERNIGIRQGHAYSKRLLDAMGIPAVARVSFAHYTSMEEVDRVCSALDPLI